MATVVREYVKLSNGTEYMEFQYMDNEGNPIDEEQATQCRILECNGDGEVLKERMGRTCHESGCQAKYYTNRFEYEIKVALEGMLIIAVIFLFVCIIGACISLL